jgi:hypothetical protein
MKVEAFGCGHRETNALCEFRTKWWNAEVPDNHLAPRKKITLCFHAYQLWLLSNLQRVMHPTARRKPRKSHRCYHLLHWECPNSSVIDLRASTQVAQM